jgi:hypothetical protein
MKHAITISDALASKKLFGPFFAGPSWSRWAAVLKASFAEPMTAGELAAFTEVAEREPPKARVKELTAIVGRGGGKDSVASVLAAYVAITFDPKGKLRPGEKCVVMLLACDREQAGIAFNYIAGLFQQVPALRAMVTRISSDAIELSNGVCVEVHTNSYRSVRGRSIICCIMDECAFWRDENFASPDVEVHAAVSPGLARIPGSMLVLISTAHRRSGLLYDRWKSFYGKADDDVLCVRGTTTQFNPTFDQGVIAKSLASDPALYSAEYNSEWRDDLSTFISRELLDAAVDSGVKVRPPQPGVQYKSFCDPSGGAGDSFAMAVTHAEGDVAVLDCLVEIRAPFNPDEATLQIAATLKSYRISATVADRYAAQWVVAAFGRNDIKLEHSKRDRSQIYLDCLPLFSAGRARLLDDTRLVAQFSQLERRTFSTGKDRVDHGRHGQDDLCNAAAGAMVLATEPSGYISDLSWVGLEQEQKQSNGQGQPRQRSVFEHPALFGGLFWPGY